MQDWICFAITLLAPPFRKRERTGANSDTHAQKSQFANCNVPHMALPGCRHCARKRWNNFEKRPGLARKVRGEEQKRTNKRPTPAKNGGRSLSSVPIARRQRENAKEMLLRKFRARPPRELSGRARDLVHGMGALCGQSQTRRPRCSNSSFGGADGWGGRKFSPSFCSSLHQAREFG